MLLLMKTGECLCLGACINISQVNVLHQLPWPVIRGPFDERLHRSAIDGRNTPAHRQAIGVCGSLSPEYLSKAQIDRMAHSRSAGLITAAEFNTTCTLQASWPLWHKVMIASAELFAWNSSHLHGRIASRVTAAAVSCMQCMSSSARAPQDFKPSIDLGKNAKVKPFVSCIWSQGTIMSAIE